MGEVYIESCNVIFPSNWLIGIGIGTAMTLMSPAVLAKKASAHFASEDEAFLVLRRAALGDDAARASRLGATLNKYEIPSYVDYYRLKLRMRVASEAEIRDFLTRYDGSAIADRLRNDWLLELGRKRDWHTFDAQYPFFALDDDTQLKCYALMSRALKGQTVADEARALLVSPKGYGDACTSLISTLAENKQFDNSDVWMQLRLAGETNAISSVRRIGRLVGQAEKPLLNAIDHPAKCLAHGVDGGSNGHQVYLIALGRYAKGGQSAQSQAVQTLLTVSKQLTPSEQAIGWAQIALQASLSLSPDAMTYWRKSDGAPLSPEAHQWKVRTALREGDWKLVRTAIKAMPPTMQDDPAWVYWLARSLRAEGKEDGSDQIAQALLASIAGQTDFYGQLASEELGLEITIPPAAAAVTEAEIAPMAENLGLRRSLKFFGMGLRFEGIREWNWEMRKMSEREHFAAAEFARQNNVLDRMVSTSERTKIEFDFNQRYPAPHNTIMQSVTHTLGLDKAWVYGLIRQESRFITNAQSPVGAAGLMQLMPATARYVARKIGLDDFSPRQVNDVDINIQLGANYLNMVLDKLDGSQTLATAAYNAGPGRPHAWRASLSRPVEGAIFAESIPFSETRGYVKKVLSNATYYGLLFGNKPQTLRQRLGTVAPKE
jgi:soluble lytic murein transglycosylase